MRSVYAVLKVGMILLVSCTEPGLEHRAGERQLASAIASADRWRRTDAELEVNRGMV